MAPLLYRGIGRRKKSLARVRLLRGAGRILVNGEDYETYFPGQADRALLLIPLQVTKTVAKYDVFAKAEGGGKSGQCGAMVLGISRALCKAEPTLEPKLRAEGLLTRDPRMKERKKYGQRGARRRFQYSKR
ncbi:MAG: 30S ribosomal protein S9 [Planctomycetota bacterium]|nr:30S ribosomal protein S9 [Planctomycetota bacterium]